MIRLNSFKQLDKHSWYSRYYKRLKASERAFCEQFIINNDHLNKGDFELKVNRLFIDEKRSKNSSIICELLLAIN